jgi:hypothetical protein
MEVYRDGELSDSHQSGRRNGAPAAAVGAPFHWDVRSLQTLSLRGLQASPFVIGVPANT